MYGLDTDRHTDLQQIENKPATPHGAGLGPLNRELDPQLFGPQAANMGSIPSLSLQSMATAPQTQPGRAVPFPPIDFKVLEAQVNQLRAAVTQFDKKIDHLSSRFNELTRDTQGRLDRYGQQLMRLEDGIQRLTADTSQRFALVAGKVNERKVTDGKVQELVDRHNLLIRNFENRLAALQKLTADQEQALLSAHAALEDARVELSRLKRI